MMLYGILTAFITGLCWTCIGIVLSCCASRKLAIVPYSFLQNFLTGAIACFLIDFQKVNLRDFFILASFIFVAGFLNSLGQMMVHNAMKRGDHAPIWAISQSALIFPFLVGIIFFHNSGTAGQWFGTMLIVAGILIPQTKEIRNISGWFISALTAFFIFGLVQTLYNIPSQLCNSVDMAGARPLSAICGSTIGWLMIAGYSRTSLHFDRNTLLVACIMALVQLGALRMFFVSLDALAAVNCGNIAFPLMTGANISAFAAYSIFIRKEKTSLLDKIGFCVVMAGLLFISL